ncbi:hypothetical protein DLS43_13985 [Staphylococcus pseudintermedius]|nr:hypothetical protein DLS43_13985 [Staphylococcus pseudintermedius]
MVQPQWKRKEILTEATTWMKFEDITLSEISIYKKADPVLFHLYEVPRIVKSIKTENRIVAARGCGSKMGS